jgi:hypothetical protein
MQKKKQANCLPGEDSKKMSQLVFTTKDRAVPWTGLERGSPSKTRYSFQAMACGWYTTIVASFVVIV